ncbi:MAG: DUF2807 domain-containing protein [Bacteroidales bacterium]|nr:DUF2807 domain-containing protein [Bacteroidales bacterium]
MPAFNSIYNRSFLDIRYVQGQQYRVVIEMEESLIPQVATEVEKGVLKIYLKGTVTMHASDKYRVVVYAPFLVEACNDGPGVMDLGTMSGSTFYADNAGEGSLFLFFEPYEDMFAYAKVRIRNRSSGTVHVDCEAGSVEIESEGEGYMEVTGWTSNLRVNNIGAGDINATDLQAERANVKLNGLGRIYVNVSVTTWVSADGGGLVEIFGDSEVVEY